MDSASRSRDWPRRYPPLLTVGIALILAVFALPSALNLPQANPGQTLEYAPVPGDQGSAAPGGNFAGLGLGQGGTGTGSAGSGNADQAGQPPPLSSLPPGQGGSPSKYQCVGNPPRQTEDPLSPPCVAFFSGDNGGATYPGVTGTDITTLFVYDGCTSASASCSPGYGPTNAGVEYTPPPGYYDLGQPPDSRPNQNIIFMRELRLWQTYFNARYQTYKRRVHFWVYFTADDSLSAESPEARKADAAANVAKLHPFAVFPRFLRDGQPYTDAMAQKGVLNFGSYALRTNQELSSFPRLIWGFEPTVEGYARMYSNFICAKVQPYRVSFSGNPADKGKPRRYGIVYEDYAAQPQLKTYEQAVERDLGGCGIGFGRDRSIFPNSATDASNPSVDMATFVKDGVTTLVVVGGSHANQHTIAAAGDGYYPEWLFAGDGLVESDGDAQGFNQREMSNAWTVTPHLLDARGGVEAACGDAVHSLDPSVGGLDLSWYCGPYDDLRQYSEGIEVAGPRLSPDSIDQGFRAIPPHSSSSPQIPACYYEAGDYTCVKDAVAEWWDTSGGNTDSQSAGCWRAALGGNRFRPGTWPSGDIGVLKSQQSDPCNTFTAKFT